MITGSTLVAPLQTHVGHPVRVRVEPVCEPRNRLTGAFRVILAIPHLILVGGPISGAVWWFWGTPNGRADWSASGGLLAAVAVLCAMIAWFAILFTGRQPQGLWDLAAYYLRWRLRAMAYLALLRDEYPPFGDGPYPAALDVAPPEQPRHKVTVAVRLILIVPHLVVLWVPWSRMGRRDDHRVVRDVTRRPVSRNAVSLQRRRAALEHSRRSVRAAAAR